MDTGHDDDTEGALRDLGWGWELKTVRTWRVCTCRLESKSSSSQPGRTELGSGPESGSLLPKSLLVDGVSEEGHRTLQESRRQQGSENGCCSESM